MLHMHILLEEMTAYITQCFDVFLSEGQEESKQRCFEIATFCNARLLFN